MELEYFHEENSVKIMIQGNIDTKGGETLTNKLNEIMKIKTANHFVFDLSTVMTTTSSGIGKLLRFYKYVDTIGGTMEIKGISDNLYNQFREIHLERIFSINK